jgi:hypothetical protein
MLINPPSIRNCRIRGATVSAFPVVILVQVYRCVDAIVQHRCRDEERMCQDLTFETRPNAGDQILAKFINVSLNMLVTVVH